MMPALIKKIADDKITIDLNHPLAGKKLNFDVEVVDHKEASDEDRKKFMPPQPAQPEQKPEEKKEENSEEEGCSGDCASCGKQ